ncbi:MAG: HAD family hydrolase [Candidatus Micrarchaeia archaeon]|jgi:putative hydrolase of the HAD superfamily
MNVKAAIFDMGGVVVDYSNYRDYYAGYLQKELGVDAELARKIVEGELLPKFYEAKIPARKFYDEMAERLGIRKKEVKWVENFVERAKVNAKTINTIKRLKPKYTTAFFSNVDNAVYVKMLKLMAPYMHLFDYHFASCKLGIAKPKHAAFRLVLSKMDVKPKEAVFIDNDKNNIKGAREIGIKAILFKNNMQLDKDLRRLGLL